ncbi:MAG TPA: hypothetical protein VGF98_15805 [Candidatus Tumulicola sp.]|jgi:hypothetical protein
MRSKTLSAAALVLLASACSAAGTNSTVPSANAGAGQVASLGQTSNDVQPNVDGTSVLKTLTKQTQIGSTVDPSNGDTVPSGITYISQAPYGGGKIKKGDLVVCNYADKNGVMGNGTTEEVLVAKAGSKPVSLIASPDLKGCAGVGAEPTYDYLYATGSTAKDVASVSPQGKLFQKISGSGLTQPYGGTFVDIGVSYSPGAGFWVGDATTGTVNRIDLGTMQKKPPVTPVIQGFKVNKGKPGSVLGPTALGEWQPGPFSSNTTLYVVDGASNILYSFAKVYNFYYGSPSVKIGPTGKTFTGPQAKSAKVLLSGAPLNGSIALTTLPNGNVIVANGKTNELIEVESTGKVLATKVVDTGTGGAIRSITAVGTSDKNTVLYFTDSNSNTVQELSS